MTKRFQLKHQTTHGQTPLPAEDARPDGSKAWPPTDMGISLSSEEALRLVQDRKGWRQMSSMRPAPQKEEPIGDLEAEAAEFAHLVICQARRRSRLAMKLAKGPTRRSSDAGGPRVPLAEHVRPTRLDALMIDRPELACELRFLIDDGLDRNQQHSMRQLYLLLLTRLRSSHAREDDHCPCTSGLGYAAFCAWVQRARTSGWEDL